MSYAMPYSMPYLLIAYKWLTWLAWPFINLLVRWRIKQGREDPMRIAERYGRAHKARPNGQLIWIHAASVGETLSVLPLIGKLLETDSQRHILLTSGTVTSADIIAKRKMARLIHQYVPIDYPLFVRRFIRHWSPSIAIFVESEFWPNLLDRAYHKNIPLILINARLSPNAYIKWKKAPTTIRTLLGRFSLILASDQLTTDRLTDLGAKHIKTLDNLKLDAPPLPFDATALETLQTQIGTRPVWLAASTHVGEDILAAQTHQALVANHQALLTIIIPRHPIRGDMIKAELETLGLNVAQRSKEEPIQAQTDIYLADTIGEMGLFYRLGQVAFIGGSLVPHGGQNPMEAAQLGMVLIHGPHISNFTSIFARLAEAQAVVAIADGLELTATVNRLLFDKDERQAMLLRAQAFAEANSGTCETYYKILQPLLAETGLAEIKREKNKNNV